MKHKNKILFVYRVSVIYRNDIFQSFHLILYEILNHNLYSIGATRYYSWILVILFEKIIISSKSTNSS